MTMTDEQYRYMRSEFDRARGFIDRHEADILAEAVRRDEAYVLHAWYYHVRREWPYLTLGDAVERAQDDCSPDYIVGPGGVKYDPYTGAEQS